MKYINSTKIIVFDQPHGKHNRDISLKEIKNRSLFVPYKNRKIWIKEQRLLWIKMKLNKILSKLKINYLENIKIRRIISKYLTSDKKFILTMRLLSQDYVLFESRLSEYLGNTEIQPIKLKCFDNALVIPDSIQFSTFVGDDIINIESINLSGYIKYINSENNNINEEFSFIIEHHHIHEYRVNSYWVNFEIFISEIIKKSNNIEIFIDKYNIKSIHSRNNILKNSLIINPINYSPTNTTIPKLILTISFDGVSYQDLINKNSNYLFPTIQSFKNISHVFDKSYVSSPTTGSSAASYTTGLGLSRHFIYDYEKSTNDKNLDILSPNISTVSEILKNIGYNCYGLTFFSAWRPHYGYARGFDQFINCSSGIYQNYPYLGKISEFIMNAKDHPVYIFLHLPGAHPPLKLGHYSNIDEANVAAYYSSLTEVDLYFKSILSLIKDMNIYDESLIFFTSDHGRAIDPYHLREYQLYEQRIRVPLYIKFHDYYDHYLSWVSKKNEPVSTMSFISDIIFDSTSAKKPKYYNEITKRKFDEITWVCEAVDYASSPMIDRYGIVGIDEKYKWVSFFRFDPITNKIGEFDELIVNKIGENGNIDESKNLKNKFSKHQLLSVVNSAEKYLIEGIKFFDSHPTVKQKDENILIKQNFIK